MSLRDLRADIKKFANIEKAKIYSRFFKTGKGEYGESDIFVGLSVPESRTIAKKYLTLEMEYVETLLNSKIHEERLIGLLLLVERFKKSDDNVRKNIFDFYISNIKSVNNWDLVDLSAHKIIGAYLIDKDRKLLYDFARSENLWEKRVSIVSTFAFIARGDFEDSLEIAKILLDDKHDLIHKAVGWVLREIGKKDINNLKDFLTENYSRLPRTTLRYAIERFSEDERKRWLRRER